MAVGSFAAKLPDEIISMVMDVLGLPYLLAMSHVCSRWNALAHVHPQFRQYIRLSAVSSTALDFFQARLGFGTQCSISISVRLPNHLLPTRVRSIIFPAIVRNMYRLWDLEINIHVDLAPLVLDVLSHPAPLLENLQLNFSNCSKRRSAPMLPPMLLASRGLQLIHLSIAGVELPTERILAFEEVKDLWINLHGRRTVPVEIFDHFPALQNLSIAGESCVGLSDKTGNILAVKLPPIKQLSLRLANRDYAAIMASVGSLPAIQHVLLREPRAEIVSQLLCHLGADSLELGLRYSGDGTVHIVLSSPGSGHTRTFVERAPQVPERMSYGTLLDPSFLSRITVLRLPFQIAGLAPPGMPAIELPHCSLLELNLAAGGVTGGALVGARVTAQLLLRALRVVEVNTGEEEFSNCMGVDAALLRAFLVQLLGGTSASRTLRLRGVVATGDCAALSLDFEIVHVREFSPQVGLPFTMPTNLFSP